MSDLNGKTHRAVLPLAKACRYERMIADEPPRQQRIPGFNEG